MVSPAVPTSRSVFRGQSRTGVGEGPGRRVLQGEQYLLVDPELYTSELLDEIRPWLTLDSDPADHQRLSDKLEGWSVFPAGDYLFVVRIASAGTYDRRAAYFSHARVWRRDAISSGMDPGLALGCTDAFAQPWRNSDPPSPIPKDPLLSFRPDLVQSERETAALYLGHLLQAMTAQYPLIIAANINDFTQGSALHALVSFCRAALPAEYRDACRIRVYSRFPQSFLRSLGVHLIAIPQETAPDAITARPTATIIDRGGAKVMGRDLDPGPYEYAKWLVERALALPGGLSLFSSRYRLQPEDLSSPMRARAAIQLTYNVAFALSGDAESRSKLVTSYLPRAATLFGPGIQWERFIERDDWRHLPSAALQDALLQNSQALTPAERELQIAIENASAAAGVTVDGRLDAWWTPNDPAKLRRLVGLLTHDPPLVTAAAAAERTILVPLDRLATCGPVHAVLRAEAETDWIRERESAQLAEHASDSRVFEILTRAVAEQRLHHEWAALFIRKTPSRGLLVPAQAWLREPTFWKQWGTVPRLLLDRLRALEEIPEEVKTVVREGCPISPASDLRLWIRFVDLLARVDRQAAQKLVPLLWPALQKLQEDDRSFVEEVAFDREWKCLHLATLDLPNLLRLGEFLRNEENIAGWCRVLDEHVRRNPETTAALLAETGWWGFWRAQSQLGSKHDDRAILGRGAFAWFRSSARSDHRPADIPFETWRIALKDLPHPLTGTRFEEMRAELETVPWPRITPFELDQIDDLIERADDLGAVAEIAEALRSDEVPDAPPAYVLSRSSFADEISVTAFSRILRGSVVQGQPLSLAESTRLCERAGHRSSQALNERIRAVAHHLKSDAVEALEAADRPNLWANAGFLHEIAVWLMRKRTIDWDAERPLLSIAEKRLSKSAEHLPAEAASLAESFSVRGFRRIAQFLDPGIGSRTLADDVIQALLHKRSHDRCWQQLALSVRLANAEHGLTPREHPLRVLADRIASRRQDQNRTVFRKGWHTFAIAAKEHPVLIAATANLRDGFPVFDVAATMLGPGAMGSAALCVYELAENHCHRDVTWWRRLLVSIRNYRRYPDVRTVEDRESVALAVLLEAIHDITDERRALQSALAVEARTGTVWAVLQELGVESS